METDKGHYYDFSEDADLLAQFDPNEVSDWYLQWTGSLVQKHLRFRNRITRITGILGHHTAVSTGFAMSIQKSLTRITLLLTVNTALIAYIAYQGS